MTPKQQRLSLVIVGLSCLGIAVGLMVYALSDNIRFFYDPSDVVAGELAVGQQARIGGLVEQGTLQRLDDSKIRFRVTDTEKSIDVAYQGLLPDLFREGQGVVADGKLVSPTQFEATRILAKHDENYMPKEVADALKEKGQWKPDGESD